MGPADLWHGGLEEKVVHRSGGDVSGGESDGRHRGVAGTPLKIKLDLEPHLLEGSDRGNV